MKPERKKHQPKTKTKKRRDPSETTGEPQITSPSTAATEDLRESSAWAAPNETTKFSGDETGRSSMASPSRPTRRRAGRRQRVESTRVQKEIVSRPSPRPRHMDIARASDDIPVRARPSKSRDFQQRCSAEDITRRSGRGQKFPQTFGSKPAQRFRKMAPGDEAARHAPEAVRSIQADATAIGASQIYLTCGSPCHNLASPSTGSRKEADVVSPTKKLSVQSISEGGISSKDDKSGPPAGAKGQSMPPCDLSLGNSYQSKTVQRTGDVSVHGEEESSGGVSAGLPSKTEQAERAMPMSGASTPSGHSKQIPKSIGQSWISQVSREMAGGVTPRKGAVLALLREGMNRKTPRDVANEAPPHHHPEEPQPCRKLSAIRSASEEIYEPTSAAESRALKMTATSLSKEKKTTVKAKETRRVHIAKPASENLIDVSDVPRVTLCCDSERSLAGYGRPPRAPSSSTGCGDQFLLNVVHASQDQVGADYDGALPSTAEHCQEGFVVVVPASFLVLVATSFLVADDGAPSLDYAAIGFRLLLGWVLATGAVAAATDLPSMLEQRIQCVSDAASALFGRSVGYEEGQILTFADWALDVAWTAAEAHRQNSPGGHANSSPTEVVDDGSLELRISQ